WSYVLAACVVVFFFQAEDGIRDWSVTGVQTCALPISARRTWPRRSRSRRAPRCTCSPGPSPAASWPASWAPRPRRTPSTRRPSRSEVRRVGKGGRSRGEGGREEEKNSKGQSERREQEC